MEQLFVLPYLVDKGFSVKEQFLLPHSVNEGKGLKRCGLESGEHVEGFVAKNDVRSHTLLISQLVTQQAQGLKELLVLLWSARKDRL